jgi:hypothetical protein
MDRRRFLDAMVVGAVGLPLQRSAFALSVPQARNVVLVHGLFAGGST